MVGGLDFTVSWLGLLGEWIRIGVGWIGLGGCLVGWWMFGFVCG